MVGCACPGCYCLFGSALALTFHLGNLGSPSCSITELQHQVASRAEPLLQGTILGVCAIQLTQDERDLSLWSPPFRGNCQKAADPLCSVQSWGCYLHASGAGAV